MVIRASDRVLDVIGRDDSLIEVFVSVSPAFRRLRSPALRRVMGRLVTVGQAARVAGMTPETLVARLNDLVGTSEAGGEPPECPAEAPPAGGDGDGAGTPVELAGIPSERVVELDVRDALNNGEEPFSRIMAAKREVPPGGALRLRAIFEPVPLYQVLARQGMRHWTERLADDDWIVWFWPAAAETAAEIAAAPAAAPAAGSGEAGGVGSGGMNGEGVIVLDVRGLEPPEPMVRTLAALDRLPKGDTLVQVNVREPRFLLPQLQERGFTWEVREQDPDLIRVFIKHAERGGNDG